jgi:hypothetical protein
MTEERPPLTAGETANTLANILLSLMRSKLKFVAVIAAVFVAGLIYAEGLSTTTVVVSIIAVFIVGFFAALVWFWTAVFTSFNSQKKP